MPMNTVADIFLAPFGAGLAHTLVQQRQPIRRDFGIDSVTHGGEAVPVRTRDIASFPFCALTEFAAAPGGGERVLLVAPLSGHFGFVLREMVLGLLPASRVYVTDWFNARFVPVAAGDFGFDDNIDCIVHAVRRLGPGVHLCGICQGVLPALAATAILAREAPGLAPATLTLVGGPVDPLANPTRVVNLLRGRPLDALAADALQTVDAGLRGAGRQVYPAHYQLSALMAYFYRHCASGGELVRKVFADDGLDPIRFPFFQLFTALMDLPARYFLENVQKVFIERQPWTGQLSWHGQRVDFGAIRNTALMTIEGEDDDIAAPGQTSAAHRLCPGIPPSMCRRLVVPGAGHFSLFYGRTWREQIVPAIAAFRHAVRPAAAASRRPEWTRTVARAAVG